MRSLKTAPLVWAVIVVSVLVTAVTEVRIAGYGHPWLSVWTAYAAFIVNIACSGLGFSTPERPWWIVNAVLSVLAMTFIGSPTIPSACWTVGRTLLARFAAG
jgi:hypothetical protein